MEEVIRQLEHAVATAQRSCAVKGPNNETTPEYQWGKLQGRYAGLVEALKIVLAVHEDAEETFASLGD